MFGCRILDILVQSRRVLLEELSVGCLALSQYLVFDVGQTGRAMSSMSGGSRIGGDGILTRGAGWSTKVDVGVSDGIHRMRGPIRY